MFKTWDRKCLALITQMVRAFDMNPMVGGSSPLQVETFSVSKHCHFHKNIRSCDENECFCPRTVNISNVNFTSQISISPGLVFKIWDNKCRALITQMVKTFDTFTRTSVLLSKMNPFARVQLKFQMLTLFKNIYIARPSVQNMGQ